jgi:hypothetical protein
MPSHSIIPFSKFSKKLFKFFLRISVSSGLCEMPPYHVRYPLRHDVHHFDLGSGVFLAVYWKSLPIGRGPSISLHIGSFEPLKFDCFGEEAGHFHTDILPLNASKNARIWMPENSRQAQVERAIFELQENSQYYLDRSQHLKCRTATVDKIRMNTSLACVRLIALDFLINVPQLSDS